jgi:hypothetical protein
MYDQTVSDEDRGNADSDAAGHVASFGTQVALCWSAGTPTMTVAIGGGADYECEGDRHQDRIECRAQP